MIDGQKAIARMSFAAGIAMLTDMLSKSFSDIAYVMPFLLIMYGALFGWSDGNA